MRLLLAVALLAACTNTDGNGATTPGEIGKRVIGACGDPPVAPKQYHDWASYTTWPDMIDYAIVYKSNWVSMMGYLDADRTWHDCVVGLD